MSFRRAAVVALSLLLFTLIPVALIQWTALFVALVILLSAGYSRRTRKNIAVIRHTTEVSCFRHQNTEIEIELRNRGLLPIAHVAVSEPTGNLSTEGLTSRVVALRPYSSMRIRYSIRGIHRGRYELGPLRIDGSDPLGLVRWHVRKGGTTVVSVYPALYPLRVGYAGGLPAGNLATPHRLYVDPTRYRSLRDYIRGDDPRHIAWSASARTGTLKTVEHLPTLYFPTVVLLNLRVDDYDPRGRYHAVERAVEAAAAVLRYAVERGQSVSLAVSASFFGQTREVDFPSGSGHGHIVGMLRGLSAAEAGPGTLDMSALLRVIGPISFGSRVFYAGPALNPSQIRPLVEVARTGASVELLYTHEKRFTPTTRQPLPFRRIPEYGAFDFA